MESGQCWIFITWSGRFTSAIGTFDDCYKNLPYEISTSLRAAIALDSDLVDLDLLKKEEGE